jgi:uncharacterized membrane protein YraQ (UPF0718 family)
MVEVVSTSFWGAVLRVGQAVIEASPFLLTGLVVAGVFRRILGRRRVHRLFGGRSWRGLLLAWGLGMLLPVCALGAFPVLRELRKARLPGGTILAFALSMPLFNPLSVLYGLTLSEPVVIFCFVLASLVVVAVAGALWDRLFPCPPGEPEELPPVAYGLRRMTAVLTAAAEDACSPAAVYLLIGLLGVAGLSLVLPHGVLQQTMAHDDPLSPLLMAAIAVPVYDSPLRVMMQIGLMFDHGNSVGAALVLLLLGAGLHLGTLAWVVAEYGWKPALVWFALIAGVTLGLAYALEKPLFDAGATIEDHTHAFDEFTAPALTSSLADMPRFVLDKLNDELDPWELFSLASLGLLAALGLGLRLLERRWSVNAWLEQVPPRPADPNQPFWNRPLPGSFLGAVALAGLVLLSTYGCYLYYPGPEEAFELTRPVKVNTLLAIKLGQREQARRGIRLWDDLTRKTEVGLYLRYGYVGPEVQQAGSALRDVLEEAYDGFEKGQWTSEDTERWFRQASKSADRFRHAVMRQIGHEAP